MSIPSKIGTTIGGKEVFPLEKLTEFIASSQCPHRDYHRSGRLERAGSGGYRRRQSGALAIWNFAPTHINVPSNIVMENVNLASSLAVLSHRLNSSLNKEN
jgi:redox-sensing transcriptional repressor